MAVSVASVAPAVVPAAGVLAAQIVVGVRVGKGPQALMVSVTVPTVAPPLAVTTTVVIYVPAASGICVVITPAGDREKRLQKQETKLRLHSR